MPSTISKQNNNADITNRDDITIALTDFYTRAFADQIIGFMFTDVAKVDLNGHVQLITDFWSSILFKDGSYTGNAMQKHIDLNSKMTLKPGHFTRWLYLFEEALDSNFSGQNTELMKKRARMIAETISDLLSRRRGDIPRGVDVLNDWLR